MFVWLDWEEGRNLYKQNTMTSSNAVMPSPFNTKLFIFLRLLLRRGKGIGSILLYFFVNGGLLEVVVNLISGSVTVSGAVLFVFGSLSPSTFLSVVSAVATKATFLFFSSFFAFFCNNSECFSFWT